MKLAHFVRHREARQEKREPRGKSKGATPQKGFLLGEPPPKHGVDHSNPVVKAFGQVWFHLHLDLSSD